MNYHNIQRVVNEKRRVGSVFLLPTIPLQNVNKLLRTYLQSLSLPTIPSYA